MRIILAKLQFLKLFLRTKIKKSHLAAARSMAASVLMIFTTILLAAQPALALTNAQLKQFSQNNILFYDPNGSDDCIEESYVRGNSNGSDVYMIGDSITHPYSYNALVEAMPNITINAHAGIYFSHDTDEFGPSGVSRISEMGNQSVLVFAVGTNGGINQMYSDDTTKFFAAMEGRNVKVILMTIYYNGYSTEQMNNTNTVVQQLASEYDNISYMDWHAVAASNPSAYIESDGVHPTAAGRQKFAELTKEAVDAVSTVGIQTSSGSGDYSKVLTARNADEYVFNVPSGDPWQANWGDGDTAGMRRVLENYGDLAYQLGDAIGAPWVAIIVQMRYEDSRSVCGANNFWGNGCPPGTGAGGASIQGRNLGEGFMQYGQTLTNGYHDQAIGISDPIEYLEAIGPTWVQGNINGPGYGSIDGMRNSVRALLAYIETEEGQSIVSQFGNYHGTSGTSRTASRVCVASSNNTAGGITYAEYMGQTIAFPLANATKETVRGYVSTLPCVGATYGCHYGADNPSGPAAAAWDLCLNGYSSWACEGAAVVSITDGDITLVTYERTHNGETAQCNHVRIRNSIDNTIIAYMHLAYEPEIVSGVHVQAGDVIGHVATGYTPCNDHTVPHVHIDKASDPSLTGGPYAEQRDSEIVDMVNTGYYALPENELELASRQSASGDPVFYQQSDPQWGSIPYGNCSGTTIAEAGCGPTSLASIIATMTGDTTVTPDVIAEKAVAAGYRVCGSGSSHAITNIATQYGLNVTDYGHPSIEEISNYLRQGVMFHVAGAGANPFTAGGHFIAIRGITDSGKWLIFDSAHSSSNNNTREWDPSEIYYSVSSDWRGVSK